MGLKMLTEDLVSSAKRRTLAPISQQTFQDSDIIFILNEEMSNVIVPEIMAVREDLFLTSITQDITGGIEKYRVPERAAGDSLKAIFYVAGNNNKQELPRLNVNRITDYVNNNGQASGVMFEGSYIRLIPAPTNAGSLELWYYARPNQLVQTSSCGAITGISSAGGTTTITVDTNLTGELSVGENFDVLSNLSPYVLGGMDVEITAITTTTVECATSDVTDASGALTIYVGDYVCVAKTANIPQIPQEFHPVLAQSAAVRLLESLGDLNKRQAAIETRDRMMANTMRLIQNRIENSIEYINSKFGFTNQRGFWGRRGAGNY